MTSLLLPSEAALRVEREELLGHTPFTEAELAERSEEGLLTLEEARLLRRLHEISFLLGE